MDYFNRVGGMLFAEQVSLADIANQYGTPAYIYSRATIERHWHAFNDALGDHPHLICYAVKANSNLAVINLMAQMGSGFDIVSVGELERVLAAGGEAGKVVFSGVGKKVNEIERAMDVEIRCFNVESASELDRINDIAIANGFQAPVSLRVNPDVDAKTHPYISTGLKANKFGVDIVTALDTYRRAAEMPGINIKGIDCHIGSQLTELSPFLDALDRVLVLAKQLEQDGIDIQHLDIGGGLGIRYMDETPPLPDEYAVALLERLKDTDYEIIMEPGRAIMGNAGILLTEVEYIKYGEEKHFAIVDAAMNDLMRPALYDAWQAIEPVMEKDIKSDIYDVVGPVCETGDFLGKERTLAIESGDLLCVRSAGAYGFSMASNYNSRPRPVELLVDGEQVHVVRKRENVKDLMGGESILN
ncbi:MAG: diaminopimelate decarboxylase [Gammaproteobacteria bacterium]|nr:MAG: diaminopimelate decarboxylase [Gammaproteobacteria bacterium]